MPHTGTAGWNARRERLDEVGSVWPVADDVTLTTGRPWRRAGDAPWLTARLRLSIM
jgi:hypothetical protein